MKIKPQVSKRVINRVKKMALSALFMGTAAYIGEHYIKDQTSTFISTDTGSFSGMFVTADELGFEGERKL